MARKVHKRAARLLSPAAARKAEASTVAKRTFGEAVLHTIQHSEPQWASWKEEKCKKFEAGQLNPQVLSKLKARRELKQRRLVNSRPLMSAAGSNTHRGAKQMHILLRA